jgi:N-hydroxyarylamine O-acetyltransferase
MSLMDRHAKSDERVASYCERIAYAGPLAPTRDTLGALHRAHMYAVPFENLDIHLGREIVLDLDRLFDKIVRQRRGGFCYELNGLFAWLLGEIGFDVTMISARVANDSGEFGPEFDHMALLVRLESVWLADVGFGDSSLDPLLFEEGLEQEIDGATWRIERDGDAWVMAQAKDDGWAPQHRFTTTARALDEFAGMCVYHQTSPDSPFTKRRVCSLATPDGRVSLTADRLIVTRDGERTERPVTDEAERASLLREVFGVNLDHTDRAK